MSALVHSRAALVEAAKAEIEAIVRHHRGEPNRALSSRRELRWGSKGSLVLTLAGEHAGRFHDFETGAGGDALDFIRAELGFDFNAALDWLAGWRGQPRPIASGGREAVPLDGDDDALKARKAAAASLIARDAAPIGGTLAERYLVARLGGPVPADAVRAGDLRFHPSPLFGREQVAGAAGALVSVMRDPRTGEGVGVQRTFLTADAAKIERRMLGRAGVVCLFPFDEVTGGLGLCEGVETGLAVQARYAWRPVWAAMSAGGLAGFPVLAGVETLTIFADHDEAGRDAADACAARWADADAEIIIRHPETRQADFAEQESA